MRFFQSSKSTAQERLLWSRDIRFATRLAGATPGSRILELESGMVVIGPASEMTDTRAAAIAEEVHSPAYGLVDLDRSLGEGERHLAAMAEAVQLSGLADRIGMSPSSQVVQMKTLDYFFSLRNVHQVAFQPIVELATGRLYEYECLFRPSMPMLPQSISAIVHAAIDTDRSIELDAFIVRLILARAGEIEAARLAVGDAPLRIAINFTPASLLSEQFEAKALALMAIDAGLSPTQITLECTEEQAVSDVDDLKRRVKALRRLGFGFAIDDAGAGYASFSLIAALRPSIIKIDRLIVVGIARDDAKQALVEAFVSFGRRIGARLLAEGIERRADLAMLSGLGVELGQGYLIGRPSFEPQPPRPIAELRLDHARAAVARRVRGAVPAPRRRPRPATAK
ncbi:MAG TPA: EAL domain-containing protein [Candidatus Limnocylindrales bacterium]|nr:EAL domain-containing protein [Candidatus Limnocylindrales bacterium]